MRTRALHFALVKILVEQLRLLLDSSSSTSVVPVVLRGKNTGH